MIFKLRFNLKAIIPVIVIIIIFTSILLFMNGHDKQEKVTTKLVYNTLEIPNLSTITPIINDVITQDDFHKNQVSILTFLGSWCVACTVELPLLKNYVSKEVPLYGLDFDEQSPNDIIRWLKIHNGEQIFNKISYDNNDTLVIDLGVTGAPESFIINKQGKIVLHVIGMINKKLWLSTLLPFINKLKKED